MNLEELLYEQLMQAILGRGGNPRTVFRKIIEVKRNQIYWELMNG